MTAGNGRRDELIGRVLAGKYRLERLVAEGGMGAVYQARHVELGSRVAVKVIGRECLTSAEHMRRFRREARAASAAESDGIVRVYDVGEDADVGLYMVMELLSGEDLERRLAREHRVSIEVALDIALQAARALAKAHAAGVIHRDLKPANIFLTTLEDGGLRVKIVDFGISKLVDDLVPSSNSRNATTKLGMLLGTPQYMSPEQAEGRTVDARSDVWSLGAVLYEMLSGRPLVDGSGHHHAVLLRILLESPMPLAMVAPHVPPRVVAAVERAITRDAAQRYPEARAFAADLAAALAEVRGRAGSTPVINVNAFAATTPGIPATPMNGTPPTLPPTTMAIAPPPSQGPSGPGATTMRAMMTGGIGFAPIAAALAAVAFFVVLAVSMLGSNAPPQRRSPPNAAETSALPPAAEVAPVTTPGSMAPSAAPSVRPSLPPLMTPHALPNARDAGAPPSRTRARPFGGAGVVEDYK